MAKTKLAAVRRGYGTRTWSFHGSSVLLYVRCLLLSVICDLRKKKGIIIEARESMGFVCTEEVWGYCTLTNEINAGWLHALVLV